MKAAGVASAALRAPSSVPITMPQKAFWKGPRRRARGREVAPAPPHGLVPKAQGGTRTVAVRELVSQRHQKDELCQPWAWRLRCHEYLICVRGMTSSS